MRKDEFAKCIIHRKAIDRAAPHRDNELSRSTIHREPGSHEFRSRQQDLLRFALTSLLELEDAKDRPHADTSIEVAAAVDRVTDDGVSGALAFGEDDAVFLLFRDQETAFSRCAHGGDEEVVADDVEFLLVVTGRVGGTGEAGQVDEGGASNVVGYAFEGELEGVAEEAGL